jgi:hypothetical protein
MFLFFFVQKFFFGQHKELKKNFVTQSAIFPPQNLTLGYMTKTLNQIIFFSSTKNRILFQQHWESEFFFRKQFIIRYIITIEFRNNKK